jgi:PEP-CTERM motif-containing protein
MRGLLIGLILALASSYAVASPCFTQPDPASPAYLCGEGTISVNPTPVYVNEPVSVDVDLLWGGPATSIASFSSGPFGNFGSFIPTGSSSTTSFGIQDTLDITGYFDAPGMTSFLVFYTDNLGGFGCAGSGPPGCPVFSIDVLTPVPEPSTWAMLLLGFAAIGFAGYRKRQHDTAVAQ